MSARILVQHGSNAGDQHWIEEEVSRIGSAADCTFVVRHIPAHSVTLLYRKGQYSVVNRSSQAIEVAGEPLLPMATLPIHGGQSISIGVDTVLQLEIDGSPAPTRRPRSVIDGNLHDDEPVVEFEGNSKSSVKKRAFLAVGILATLYLLVGDTSSSKPEGSSVSRQFTEIVDSLQSNVAVNDDGPARICRALQIARTSEIRGNVERAIAHYEIAKDMVLDDEENPGCPVRNVSRSVRQTTFGFIQDRLGSL